MTRPKITDKTEFCAPTEGPVMAYYGARAAARKSTQGEPKHAMPLWSLAGGAMDTECGTIGGIEAGPWDPDDPHNCRICAQFVAGTRRMPRDKPTRKPTPARVPVAAPILAPVQLTLFQAAA